MCVLPPRASVRIAGGGKKVRKRALIFYDPLPNRHRHFFWMGLIMVALIMQHLRIGERHP